MVQFNRLRVCCDYHDSFRVTGTTAAVPAIPSEILPKMLKQVSDDAAWLLRELYNLTNTFHILALARFEAFDQLLFQGGNVGRTRFDAIPLTQACYFERQVTLFLEIVECFDDARTRRVKA